MARTSEAKRAYRAAEALIANALSNHETELDFTGEEFSALDQIPPAIAELEDLLYLNLAAPPVTDLTPIASLSALRYLSLDRTGVTDLAPIASLTALQGLSLNRTGVTDLAPIASLTALQDLSLDRTGVTDLAPIASLTALERLSLDGTAVTDLVPISSLLALEYLSLDRTGVTDLAPIASLTALQDLSLDRTGVTDLAPIASLTALQTLSLDRTGVTDLAPIASLTALQTLSLDLTDVTDLAPLVSLTALRFLPLVGTGITDLSPIASLTELEHLSLDGTGVTDLRPIRDLEKLGSGPIRGLYYGDTPAVARDPELARLSEIRGAGERTKKTLAYLKTLPPWPDPLPWEVEAARTEAPAPEPGLPLVVAGDRIAFATSEVGEAEAGDPVRATLFEALAERVADLIRIAGNRDEAAYREACRLRDLQEAGLVHMDALRVHLAVEALRRVRGGLPAEADLDLALAIGAVVDIGPGLTLDTPEVETFLDRARRNRLERRSAAEEEAEIRLAEGIAATELGAPEVRDFALASADRGADTQMTAMRQTLTKNWVFVLGTFLLDRSVGGAIGNGFYQHGLPWLAAHAPDILTVARFWGEPVLAWIAPILDRAQQIVAAAGQISGRLRDRQ
ncbi:leucine-rich repeat domain-containing protein [Frigidibacter sp. SD6-1]|uniref:leucine-rich repeat domain-containing protein n=2 Tax=Frigidibacter sp. SD6-1 TaxID=3032581 RepID=UPI0024DF7225|nr:leucine-rich repeat domain-containing protein [Frigidibacter sp. SD6-1]